MTVPKAHGALPVLIIPGEKSNVKDALACLGGLSLRRGDWIKINGVGFSKVG
jgi:hypothetical protein